MPSCSEGSRGLSVLPREVRIFTNSTISPGPWLRQRPSRYAVRAGRNLPDKEFRYLRTVIVTAAVYRAWVHCFASRLTDPRDLPHRAGVRPYTSPCGLAESCVFDKQSLGLFRCGRGPPGGSPFTARGAPSSLSYGAIVPSSLTMVPPIASVCSTRPPVSVLVRAPGPSLEVFLGSMGLDGFARRLRLASRAPCRADFHALRPTRFHGDVQNPARLPSSVAPSVITVPRRCRNVRLLRIGYACRPRLSSRLTLGD